jgi:hypothetical protein
MYKNVLSIGVILNKAEQLKIMEGVSPDCEGTILQGPTIVTVAQLRFESNQVFPMNF